MSSQEHNSSTCLASEEVALVVEVAVGTMVVLEEERDEVAVEGEPIVEGVVAITEVGISTEANFLPR
jgi:hypothetical protein